LCVAAQHPDLERSLREDRQLAKAAYRCYIPDMITVQEIESAIEHLPKSKLSQFRLWFDEFDARQWDKRLELDAKTGKLDVLADAALSDLKENRCKEL
jgi:hypothetical protein